MREIEVKAKLKDRKKVETKLKELGGKLSDPVKQEDVVYNHKDKNVYALGKDAGAVLRIRKSKGETLLTLKKNLTSELDCLEHESKISDPIEIHNILTVLQFVPMVEINKLRSKCNVGEYEICLDNVEGLGDFIEVEYLCEDGDGEEISEELMKFLESLGVSREDRVTSGYDTLIYNLKNNIS